LNEVVYIIYIPVQLIVIQIPNQVENVKIPHVLPQAIFPF